jgi:hypothetical protein
LRGWVELDRQADTERGGQLGKLDQLLGSPDRITVIAQHVRQWRAQLRACFERAGEVRNDGAAGHGERIDEIDSDPVRIEHLARLAPSGAVPRKVVLRHGGEHRHRMEERAYARAPRRSRDLGKLRRGGVGDGDVVEGKLHDRNQTAASRSFTMSSATSTIMSSWPPTILRRPSSTRIARVSMP